MHFFELASDEKCRQTEQVQLLRSDNVHSEEALIQDRDGNMQGLRLEVFFIMDGDEPIDQECALTIADQGFGNLVADRV